MRIDPTKSLTHTFMSALRDRLLQTQGGRWVLGILFLVAAALCAVFALAVTDLTMQIGFGLGAAFFLLLALILMVGNVLIVLRGGSLIAKEQARVKELLAEGKLLPIPALPAPPQGVTPADIATVEKYAERLRAVPWGKKARISETQAHVTFEQLVSEDIDVSGDWSKLSGPIGAFAALPRPWCHVGAAEVMFRLSYLRGTTYVPVGLRQGLRFALYAQVKEPLQPDALVAQLKLLSACRAASWQDLATRTLTMVQRVAPRHPRLPKAEMFYHRMRGEYEEAVECADRALEFDTTPATAAATLSSKALLLMELKRNEEARDTFQEAVTRNPNDPWIWHNMSLVETRLGNYQEALQENTRALSLMQFGAAQQQRAFILKKMQG